MKGKQHKQMSGKYGEDDEVENEQLNVKPPSRPGAKMVGRVSYEKAAGLSDEDVAELMKNGDEQKSYTVNSKNKDTLKGRTETMEEQDAKMKEATMSSNNTDDDARKDSIEEQDARLKRESAMGDSSASRTTRKETIEEQDARLKREAMMGTTAPHAPATGNRVGPEIIADGDRFVSDVIQPGAMTVERGDKHSKEKATTVATALVPGAVAVSSNQKPTPKSAPALFPAEVDEEGEHGGNNRKDGPRLIDNVQEPDIDFQEMEAGNNDNNTIEIVADTNRLSVPGAVRVAGVDAVQDSAMDEADLHDEYDTEVQASQPGRTTSTALPTAVAIEEDEDEDNQAGDDEILASYQHAEVAELDEKEETKGILGLIGSHPYITALLLVLVVGGIIGGIIGANSGGGSSPSAQAPVPTVSPSSAPTLAPTSEFEGKLFNLLSPKTPEALLFDISTPQGMAFRFMLEDDGYSYSIEDGEDENVKLSERFALVTFFYATNGPQWVQNCSFLSSTDYCEWKVTNDVGTLIGLQECDEQGHAGSIVLPDLNISGTIPPEIGYLTGVSDLSIARNPYLSGSLPGELFKLTLLEDIRIFGNSLTGILPAEIGDLTSLTYLAIQENNFIGALPTTIGNLVLLERWFADENEFSGPLPSEIGNLVNLAVWFAEDMALSGSVPSEVSRMTSLQTFYIDGNDITDGINNFCTENTTINTFSADCLGNSFPFEEAEVECACCSVCCNDALQACLPTENK